MDEDLISPYDYSIMIRNVPKEWCDENRIR